MVEKCVGNFTIKNKEYMMNYCISKQKELVLNREVHICRLKLFFKLLRLYVLV